MSTPSRRRTSRRRRPESDHTAIRAPGAETRSLRVGDRRCGPRHIESRLGAPRGAGRGAPPGPPTTRPMGRACRHRLPDPRPWAPERRAAAVGPEQQEGQGDRRQVADADRHRPAAPRTRSPWSARSSSCSSSWSPSSPASICALFGVSTDTVLAEPVPRRPQRRPAASRSTARPTAASPSTTRSASRPAPATDNLAYWLYGARTSLVIASGATLFASVVGIVVGLARRLPRRRRRQGHLVLHRPVPHDPVPARRADHRADHQRALQRQRQLPARSRVRAWSSCWRCSAGWAWPA